MNVSAGLLLKSFLWIRIHTDPHSFWSDGFGSGSRRAKLTHKSAENSLLRDEDFSCSSNVRYVVLGISKLQCSIKNYIFFSCKFFPIFGHQNPGCGSGSACHKKCWIRFGSVSGSALKPMRIHNTAEIIHKSINTFQYPINATLLIIL